MAAQNVVKAKTMELASGGIYALDMCGRYFSTDSMTPVQ